ncbi:MAG TPA: HEAT repeat domain-containing protein [Polyangiaceae bacterium]
MGLFDLFRKTDRASAGPKVDREIARLERLVSNKLSQNLDRQDALEQLGRLGTAEAATVLLKRFNWYLDPSITDHEEKETAVRGIVNAGEAALEPIREYCKRAEGLAWPLKALEQIVARDRFVEELLLLLDQYDTEYVRNPEPKVQLLHILEGYPQPDVKMAVEQFVEDASEPVRFAAVGTLFAMGQQDAVVALIPLLGREESLRIKNRIAQGIAEKGWTVPQELCSDCRKALPQGYWLDAAGHITGQPQ